MMFWVSQDSKIQARFIDKGGAAGGEVTLATAEAKVARTTAVRLADKCVVVWQTVDGRMAGKVVDDGLASTGDLGFLDWPTVKRYTPSLSPAEDGALLVYTRTEGVNSKVVQVFVDQKGTVGSETSLGGPVVNATASPTSGAFGPFHSCFAYQDTVSVDEGLRVGLTSAACEWGPVTCNGIPSVCVGFGKTGYVTLPSVDWGCP